MEVDDEIDVDPETQKQIYLEYSRCKNCCWLEDKKLCQLSGDQMDQEDTCECFRVKE